MFSTTVLHFIAEAAFCLRGGDGWLSGEFIAWVLPSSGRWVAVISTFSPVFRNAQLSKTAPEEGGADSLAAAAVLARNRGLNCLHRR
jgi:hypothetical protein